LREEEDIIVLRGLILPADLMVAVPYAETTDFITTIKENFLLTTRFTYFTGGVQGG